MNEQNKKLEVIRRRCEKSARIVGIFQILVIVGFTISLISAIAIFASAGKLDPVLAEQVESGKVTLSTMEINSGLIDQSIDYSYFYNKGQYAFPIAINCAFATIACGVVIVLFNIFKNIFKICATEETPFSDAVRRKLKVGFIIMTVFAVFVSGLGAGVVVGLLLWCIYSIFEYGAALQTEVDDMV